MIQNMRDLGGLKNRDGKMIKAHCLIRSAHLAQAAEEDLEGVSAVIDLRTPEESRQAPDRTWGREYLSLPVFTAEQAGISYGHGLAGQLIPDMAFLYGRLVRECAEPLRKIVLTVLEHDFSAGAILWHCTEGKDRCGITSALILQILGVDRQTILEDYLKTNLVNMPKAIQIRDRLIPAHGKEFADSVYQAYIADGKYLQAAWDAMGENYVEEILGIGPEKISAFRDAVLE